MLETFSKSKNLAFSDSLINSYEFPESFELMNFKFGCRTSEVAKQPRRSGMKSPFSLS